MSTTEQDYAEELQQLVFKHSIPAVYVDELVAATSNQCAVELIHEIEHENDLRKKRKQGAIGVPANFRQSIRKKKALFKENLVNEQADIEHVRHKQAVAESYASGFRPDEDRLITGLGSDLSDDERTRTLKFIVSLRQGKKVEAAKDSGGSAND